MTDVKKAKKRRMAGNYLLFLGPTLFLFFALEILPLIMGIGYSFTDWNGIAESAHFVGLKNYIKLFTTDTRYWNSMLFTFKNTLVVVVFSNLIGFWLAYGLAKKVPFRNFMRAAFYLPRLIGGVILGFVWQFICLLGFGYRPNLGHGRLHDDHLCCRPYHHSKRLSGSSNHRWCHCTAATDQDCSATADAQHYRMLVPISFELVQSLRCQPSTDRWWTVSLF